MDAANLLKPMLARGELKMVGATTLAEYRKVERDAALARRFSAVTVDAPSVDETVEILRGLRAAYEEHHGTTITDEALEAGYEKVALYALAGVPKHAARQLPGGGWTSKLGELDDIEHTLEGLVGSWYGNVVQILKRPVATPGCGQP